MSKKSKTPSSVEVSATVTRETPRILSKTLRRDLGAVLDVAVRDGTPFLIERRGQVDAVVVPVTTDCLEPVNQLGRPMQIDKP